MSEITEPIVLDKTAKEIVEKLHTQNVLLNAIAGMQMEEIGSLKEIGRIVASGNAEKVFNIGDQIIVPWTDVAANKTYEMPFGVQQVCRSRTGRWREGIRHGNPGRLCASIWDTVFTVPAFYRVKTGRGRQRQRRKRACTRNLQCADGSTMGLM